MIELRAAACQLTYRDSIFKTSGQWTILALTIRLRGHLARRPSTSRPGDAAGLRALIVRSVIACHGLDEAGRHGGALMEDAAPRPP